MFGEKIIPTGTLTIEVKDAIGNTKEVREVKNLIVNGGLELLASRLKDASSTVPSHMAVGTGTAAAVGSQTALVAESARVAFSNANLVTTNVTADSLQYVATFGSGVATGTLTEAGLFNAATSGTMFSRTVFAAINKTASDSVTITWKIVVA